MSTGINHPLQSYEGDASAQGGVYTTGNGAAVAHPYESQRAGMDGPLLLQDYHLIELISHFDRERIPERVVHAKGAGAHGTFTCTKPLTDICLSSIFSQVGNTCPVTVRFSTVGGESGSPDTARDPRGFAMTLKTSEGNLGWVFNNTPVFFLRDPVKFPAFIHTQKRDVRTHCDAHEDATNFWDYLSNNPESLHQVMILFGDRGIPDGYRKMHGYSGHTLKLVNANSEWVYCQIHFLSQQGTAFFTQEEGDKMAAKSPNYATKDLFDAIEKGDFPKWKCYVQTMTAKEAEESNINVFDLTKVWPHDKYPLREFGEMELNQNPQNYFAEVEQAAFSPSFLIPGVEPSADPVLQSRLFSYPDTHRHRLGPNYQQLPVNQHLVKRAANFQRDGAGAFYNQGARPNYFSSIKPLHLDARKQDLDKVHNHFVGNAISYLSELQPIDFEQPRALWTKVFDDGAKKRFISNVAGHMGSVREPSVIKRQLAIFSEMAPECAAGIAKELKITDYPKGVEGLNFNGTRNGLQPGGYKPKNVTPQGYSNGHANGHPSDNAKFNQ